MKKFLLHFRKNHYGFLRPFKFATVAFAAVVFAIIFVSDANAQCPGGAEPDALGCPTMPDPSALLKGSPASISIEETNHAPLTVRFSH